MRDEKQYLLDDIKQRMENAKAFIVTQYKGIDANSMSEFRSQLKRAGNDFEVISKRVFLKAAIEKGLDFKKEDLLGHIGVVFSDDDYITAAKDVHSLEKLEKAEILSGYIEGKIYEKSDIIKLSKLPSLDGMRAEFIGTLEAPMGQTLGVFDAILTSVIHCIENKAKQ